jgi:hypothetical protein
MNTVQYSFHSDPEIRQQPSDRDDHPAHGVLAWDAPAGETVTGFVVCVDTQTGTECQDVGKPAGRRLPTTTAGSLTYQIALARLTPLTDGMNTISVIAYNTNGSSLTSSALAIDFEDRGKGR